MDDARYAMTVELPGVDFDDALARVTKALATEGFGVLTEIDVQATLKAKLGVDTPRYAILGACNPSLAHRAVSVEPRIGLLLPCNVVVAETSDGGSVVHLINAREIFRIVDRTDLAPLLSEVDTKLRQAMSQI